MKIAIIGAGVIGCATAWEFLRQGKEVLLLESREGPGLVASYANGGQLSYDYVAPLADPGVFLDLPKWLLNPGSPLRFRPQLDPRQWCWLLAFLKASNTSTAQASTKALLQLSSLSRDTLHTWMAEEPIDFHYKANGKLIAYRSPHLLEKARKQVEYQASQGSNQRILSKEESIALEPALANLGQALVGCVYTSTEEVGDCHLFTRALFERVQAHPRATTRCNSRVARLNIRQGKVVSAQLSNGEQIEADQFVLTNGLQGYDLLKQHGETIQLYGLKGYSLTIPLPAADSATAVAAAPEISVTDYERRIVYARLGDSVRIAAMVDIGDGSAAIRPDRIRHLKEEVSKSFPRLEVERAEAWAGERPATPEGRPIISRSRKLDNLWLNLGHGALGFTLACGSAVLLNALMSQSTVPINALPFRTR
ncbi:D-amino acid dehydrogenase [Achromobacter sp. F4_2707]|uniref:D-amino acid dehydrogenase n=1 Tax=Achromobacter sp. F4_2707 TaxID=3114286 RepID=UPI0039C7367F